MFQAAPIPERTNVDLRTFREEIQPAAQPVVLRGLVKDWPAAVAGQGSPRALADLIRRFDLGRMPNIVEVPAEAQGRLFYRDDLSGLNFIRLAAPIGATLERLLSLASEPDPPGVYIESMITEDFLPDFAAAHPMPLLDSQVGPRIWIGNRIKVQTHFDLLYNLACVVGGRRRFTLFPPGQVANLYISPVDFTPAGTPVSMAPLTAPDLQRYPRFAEAMRHAVSAELGPGDAIFIPYGWWHHVESLTSFNVLVNYWWNPAPKMGSPYGVLLHAALSLRDLPADQRAVWKGLFDVLVFTDPETALAHLPPDKRGLLGPPSAERTREIRSVLLQTFSKP